MGRPDWEWVEVPDEMYTPGMKVPPTEEEMAELYRQTVANPVMTESERELVKRWQDLKKEEGME